MKKGGDIMYNFENSTFEGIHYSRIIASWYNVGGKRIRSHVDSEKRPNDFVRWLRTLSINGRNIPEDVIHDILEMASNGKMELEFEAYNYMKENGLA